MAGESLQVDFKPHYTLTAKHELHVTPTGTRPGFRQTLKHQKDKKGVKFCFSAFLSLKQKKKQLMQSSVLSCLPSICSSGVLILCIIFRGWMCTLSYYGHGFKVDANVKTSKCTL